MKIHWLGALCALLLPSMASADVYPVTEDRLVLNGGFGGGGNVAIEVSNTGVAPLTSTHGAIVGGIAGIQYEHVLAPYFVLGGRFGMNRYDWSDNSSNHRTWLDFDAVPMFTLAIDAGPLVVEPRLSMPVGLGMNVWNANDDLLNFDGIKRTNFAWNIGGLGGALLRFREGSDFVRRLGVTVEAGYMHHAAYATGQGSDWRYKLTLDQAVVQVGLAISLP